MKKLVFALALAACVAALSAQTPGPGAQQDKRPNSPPPAAQASKVTLSGVLAFVDERPAIKTDSATVLLEMPDFFKYAYFDGIKAGAAIKVTGALMAAPPALDDKGQSPSVGKPDAKTAAASAPLQLAAIDAQEVTIGASTYVIVAGPRGDMGDGRDSKAIRK